MSEAPSLAGPDGGELRPAHAAKGWISVVDPAGPRLKDREVHYTTIAILAAFVLVHVDAASHNYAEQEFSAVLGLGLIGLSFGARSFPRFTRLAVPLGYLFLIAMLRESAGGTRSGLSSMFLLPILWLAFAAGPAEVVLGLLCLFAAFAIPLIWIGGTHYPSTGWRGAVELTSIAAIAGAAIQRLGAEVRSSRDSMEAERDRLGVLLERLHDGVLAVDSELRIAFVNTHAKALADVPLEAGDTLPPVFLGLPFGDIARKLVSPSGTATDDRGETAEGAVISVVGIPAASSDLAILVLTDVSERERRQQAEREFVANASHEFRTPVASIAAAVEALQSGARDDPESRERFMGVIERQSARLARLTRSLLVLARAQSDDEPVQLEPVPIAILLDQIAASLEPRDGVTLRVDCSSRLVALSEPALLEQIVSNLVGNATKHTASGEILVRATERESAVVIEVSDHGTGIPWAVQGRMFERFYSGDSTRRDGFGLGLAIARDATRALGGVLTVESEPDKGTVARVTLRGGASA